MAVKLSGQIWHVLFYVTKKQWRSEPSAEILDTQIRRTW